MESTIPNHRIQLPKPRQPIQNQQGRTMDLPWRILPRLFLRYSLSTNIHLFPIPLRNIIQHNRQCQTKPSPECKHEYIHNTVTQKEHSPQSIHNIHKIKCTTNIHQLHPWHKKKNCSKCLKFTCSLILFTPQQQNYSEKLAYSKLILYLCTRKTKKDITSRSGAVGSSPGS